MMKNSIISIILIAICVLANSGDVSTAIVPGKGIVACYYASWARYRVGHGQIGAEDLNPSGCTHLIYAFAGLDENTNKIQSLDPRNDLSTNGGYGSYLKATDFKNKYPDLKVTLSIGGPTESPTKYSIMANSTENRKIFVNSVVEFLKEYNFDGLDLNWVTPTESDSDAYVLLLNDLKNAFSTNEYLLTISISEDLSIIHESYKLLEINPIVDVIHVLTLNHTAEENVVSPLGSKFFIWSSINFIKNRIPIDKVVATVPFYGSANILRNAKDNIVGSRRSGVFHGPYIQEDGIVGYNEICSLLKDGEWESDDDVFSETTIRQKDLQLIVYDNATTIADKAKLVLGYGGAGVALWAIEMDDVYNDCGEGSWSLIRAAAEAVNGPNSI